jgi:ATP-dependent RNA helicase UAP56/SUB2
MYEIPQKGLEIFKNNSKPFHEIYIDDQSKLTLHGLHQFYVEIDEKEKTKQLMQLLEKLNYNQAIIFTSKVDRAKFLNRILNKMEFESIAIFRGMSQQKRIENYNLFKECKKRIIVTTNLFSRGIDIERVNVVINYDMSESDDTYLHRVGRAGRYGTKGIAISFVTTTEEKGILKTIQDRFVVQVKEMPEKIDESLYSKINKETIKMF